MLLWLNKLYVHGLCVAVLDLKLYCLLLRELLAYCVVNASNPIAIHSPKSILQLDISVEYIHKPFAC